MCFTQALSNSSLVLISGYCRHTGVAPRSLHRLWQEHICWWWGSPTLTIEPNRCEISCWDVLAFEAASVSTTIRPHGRPLDVSSLLCFLQSQVIVTIRKLCVYVCVCGLFLPSLTVKKAEVSLENTLGRWYRRGRCVCNRFEGNTIGRNLNRKEITPYWANRKEWDGEFYAKIIQTSRPRGMPVSISDTVWHKKYEFLRGLNMERKYILHKALMWTPLTFRKIYLLLCR